MYPAVDGVPRIADQDYIIPNTSYKISKGTMFIVPIFSVQRDPEIYPDPDKFDPDRFSEEEMAKRHQFAFTPFGEGPRICIGMRFGLMQVRLGLVALLRKYKISHSSKTSKDIKFKPTASTLILEGGTWLRVEKL